MKTRYHSPALFSQKYIQRTSLIEDIYLDCCPLLRLLPSYPPLLTNTSPKTRRLRHTLYPVQNIFKKRCPIWWWMYPGIHYIFTEFDLCLRCRTLLKHGIKSTLISISWQIVFSLTNLRYLSLSRNVLTSMNLTVFSSLMKLCIIIPWNCFNSDFDQLIASWHSLIPTNRRSPKHRVIITLKKMAEKRTWTALVLLYPKSAILRIYHQRLWSLNRIPLL